MSAGICIMNRQAIAMAADSAVTIGDHAAIHNSANKLFSLSRSAPVGLIIYSNANFMSVPFEIIVKEYKKFLGDETFPHLNGYVDHFLDYIENHPTLFRFDLNERNYVTSVFVELISGISHDCQIEKNIREAKLQRPLTVTEFLDVKNQEYQNTINYMDNIPRRDDYCFSEYVKHTYLEYFKDILSDDPDFQWLNPEQIDILCQKACKLFDTDFNRNGYVGLAIAGYGEDEIYPHMVHLNLDGYLNNKLRYHFIDTIEITEEQHASIIPLAQTDVMQTFLFGINDRFLSDLSDEVPKQIRDSINKIDNSLLSNDKKDEIYEQINNSMTTNLFEHMVEVAQKDYMSPIISSVSTLPIEELALLAESMINITSIRRKVALDRNIGTVGGPIDIAIISKGDGLIWLKRKHYFDIKNNLQYYYSHFDKRKEPYNE